MANIPRREDWLLDQAIAQRDKRVDEEVATTWKLRYIDGVIALMIDATRDDRLRYAIEIREVLGTQP